jgi:hypothetical protein
MTMRARLVTAILLIVCGAWIGWLAYENLMWGVWGKQNRWFEHAGFLGCQMMFLSGLVVLKSLRLGSLLGRAGFVLMLFYLGPALVNTFHALRLGRLTLDAPHFVELALIIAIPMITLVRLVLNVKQQKG